MPRIYTLIVSFCLLFSVNAYSWDLGKEGNFKFEKVNQNIYVMHGPLSEPNAANHGFMNNPGFIISDNGLIVIDPGSSYTVGNEVLNEIGKVTNKPILAVFNTHIHGDHWLANQAIQKKYPSVKIYGHPEMIRQANGEQGVIWVDLMHRLTAGLTAGTKVVAPKFAVNQGQQIIVDGQHFRIHSMIPSHTNTDIMIEHIESKTLFMGDNSLYQRMGRFDNSSSMIGNIKILEYATNLNLTTYVPGHGHTGSSATAIKPFLDYLKKVKAVVQTGFDDGLQGYEIKEKVIQQFSGYQSWAGFDTNFGRNINKMFLETEEAAW